MTDQEAEWRPLFLREKDDADAAAYAVLVDGVPNWLEQSLWRWAMDRAATGHQELAYKAERFLRLQLPQAGPYESTFQAYWRLANPEGKLALLDFFLRDLQDRRGVALRDSKYRWADELLRSAHELDTILVQGSSLWAVSLDGPHWGLIRRAGETALEQVEVVASSGTDAAKRIKAAWNACYRHSPNYDSAYADAVLAVEAVVLPLTSPKDSNATLGKAISHIRDTKAQWSLGGLGTAEAPAVDTVISMLQLLWTNHERHARNDGSIHDVSREEAEAAVGLAVTLVQWFSTGLVQRS